MLNGSRSFFSSWRILNDTIDLTPVAMSYSNWSVRQNSTTKFYFDCYHVFSNLSIDKADSDWQLSLIPQRGTALQWVQLTHRSLSIQGESRAILRGSGGFAFLLEFSEYLSLDWLDWNQYSIKKCFPVSASPASLAIVRV